MIISLSRRFIFVHLHKCAGESIEIGIAPFLRVNDILNGAGASTTESWLTEMMLDRLIGLAKHSSAREIKERMGEFYDYFYTFAVVRRPDRRIHSLYSFFIGLVRQSPGLIALLGEEPVRTLPWPALLSLLWGRLGLTPEAAAAALESGTLPAGGEFLTTEDIFTYSGVRGALLSDSFAAFIRHPSTQSDPAFETQWAMVSDAGGNCIVRKIIRLEDLDRDWPAVAARLSLGPLPARHNASDYGGVPGMTAADSVYLAQAFAVDYEHFGYDRP